jgi:hypothetical protein
MKNSSTFKHSSRDRPWELSTRAFWVAFPVECRTNSICRSTRHSQKYRLVSCYRIVHEIQRPLLVRLSPGT